MTAAALALALIAPTAAPEPKAPDVRPAVRTGLKWLADQQKKNGSWSGANDLLPTVSTSTAGIAFLMQGSTLKDGPYAPQLRKALAWFEDGFRADGRFSSGAPADEYQYLPNHGHALLFLACAYEADDDELRRARIAKLIEKGVAFAVGCQTSRGGFGYISARDGNNYDDGPSTVAVLQALMAARKAGFAVPRDAVRKATAYLVRATNRDGGVRYSLAPGAVAPGDTSGYVLVTTGAATALLMSDGPRPDELARWVQNAGSASAQETANIRSGGAYAMLQPFQMARAAFMLGERGHRKHDVGVTDDKLVRWSVYRDPLYKVLKATQNKDGSWPDPYTTAPYTTAMALVVLQLDNEYLPAFSR